MTEPELIAWEDVPEGDYVWWRAPSNPWQLARKRNASSFQVGQFNYELWGNHGFEFARAEQQPGDAAYWYAESTKDCKRADAAEAELTRLREGLATLKQEMRRTGEEGYTNGGHAIRWSLKLKAMVGGQK